jgi:hypothetical protein
VIVDNVKYIPVKKAPENTDTSTPINPKTSEKPVNTFKIGDKTYVPEKMIPKVFKTAFEVSKPV